MYFCTTLLAMGLSHFSPVMAGYRFPLPDGIPAGEDAATTWLHNVRGLSQAKPVLPPVFRTNSMAALGHQ